MGTTQRLRGPQVAYGLLATSRCTAPRGGPRRAAPEDGAGSERARARVDQVEARSPDLAAIMCSQGHDPEDGRQRASRQRSSSRMARSRRTGGAARQKREAAPRAWGGGEAKDEMRRGDRPVCADFGEKRPGSQLLIGSRQPPAAVGERPVGRLPQPVRSEVGLSAGRSVRPKMHLNRALMPPSHIEAEHRPGSAGTCDP